MLAEPKPATLRRVSPQHPEPLANEPTSPPSSSTREDDPGEPLCLTLLLQEAERSPEGAENLRQYLQSRSGSCSDSPSDSECLDCYTPLLREMEREQAGLPEEALDEAEIEFRRRAGIWPPSPPSPGDCSGTK